MITHRERRKIHHSRDELDRLEAELRAARDRLCLLQGTMLVIERRVARAKIQSLERRIDLLNRRIARS